jgi:hypothetical protein
MRNLLLCFAAAIFLLSAPLTSIASDPDLRELKLVAHLPPELPQRITGLAYDGEKFWATIYLGKGRYTTLDPSTLTWETNNESEHYKVISSVAGAFQSPGGICFTERMLWITGAYGESFGSIDTKTWRVHRLFKGKQREDDASQFYSSVACDGN